MRSCFLGFVYLLVGGLSLSAESISVNFGETGDGYDRISLDTGTYYGVLPVVGANWNLQAGKEGTIANLKDESGTATAASVTWTSPNTWRPYTDAPTTRDARLFWSYLDDSTGNTIQMTGVPYEIYNVYVYSSTDNGNRAFGPVIANNTHYTYTNGQTSSGKMPWGDSNKARLPGSTFVEGGNYLQISNLAGNLSLVHYNAYNGARGCTAAIQVQNALPDDYVWNKVETDDTGNAVVPATNTGLKVTFNSSESTTITTSQAATMDILKLADANTPTSQSNVALNGGQLTFSGSNAAIYANGLSTYTVLTINNPISADTLTLYANGENTENPGKPGRVKLDSVFTGKLRLGSGTLTLDSKALGTCSELVLDGGSIFCYTNGATFAKDMKIAGGGGFRVGTGNSLTYTGTLSDEVEGQRGVFRKTNPGTLNFNGNAAGFTGTFVAENGTMVLDGDSLENSSANIIAYGGAVNLKGNLTGYTGSVTTSSSTATVESSLSGKNNTFYLYGGTLNLTGKTDGFTGNFVSSTLSSSVSLNITNDFTHYSGTLDFFYGTATLSGSLDGLSGTLNNHARNNASSAMNISGSLKDFTGTIDTYGFSDSTTTKLGTTTLSSDLTGTGTISTKNYGITNLSGSLEAFEGTVHN